MDSYVFRLLALDLKKFMQGGRVEKIHSPAPGLLSMVVYSHGRKQVLVLRHSKFVNPGTGDVRAIKGNGEQRSPALYLSAQKLPNPEKPSTLVMTLRKYLAGHRLGAASIDWLNRRIFFPLPQLGPIPKTPCPLWLCLDLLNGPSLVHEIPEINQPEWPIPMRPEAAPSADTIEAWAASLRDILADGNIWRNYPALTPALRKTLTALLKRDPWEAAALLADLQYDLERVSGELRLYEFAGAPHLLSAWPLPEKIAADLKELPVYHDDGNAPSFPALEAARLVFEPQVLAHLGANGRKEEARAASAEEKRLGKALLKLEQEEERLHQMANLRARAVLLQSSLWRYGPDEKTASASFTAEESPNGLPQSIELDPLLTVRENMARLFKQSDRGLRGLEFVRKRRLELQAELAAVKSGLNLNGPNPPGPRKAATQPRGQEKNRPGKTGLAGPARLIQRFVSSDGFVILRGRSAEGNQALLKLVQPHDLWLHVEGGPSAHVVIRREHLGQEIPERTRLEAGILSAVKSWRKTDAKAEIIAALVKDVRPLKGGAPGTVLVDKRQAGFVVSLDSELEARLKGEASETGQSDTDI